MTPEDEPQEDAREREDGGFRPRFFVMLPAPAAAAGGPVLELEPGARVVLSPEDSHHAGRVLRIHPGDACEVVLVAGAGEGRLYEARVADVGSETAVVLERPVVLPPARVHLTLVQALTQPRLIDTIVEKGTEVGIDHFLFVPAAESPPVPLERLEKKLSRWNRIALEAAKQSKQVAVPSVEVRGRDDAVQELIAAGARSLILDPAAPRSLAQLLPSVVAAGRGRGTEPLELALWIGPEAGWSREELEGFQTVGELVGLGRRVLRAETAGPVVAALVRFTLRDW